MLRVTRFFSAKFNDTDTDNQIFNDFWYLKKFVQIE